MPPDDPAPASQDPGPEAGDRPAEHEPGSALRVLQNSPLVPSCPQQHGRLVPAADASAATGVSLSCPTCGFHRELEVELLRTLLSAPTAPPPRPADPPTVRTPSAETVRLPRPAPAPEPAPPRTPPWTAAPMEPGYRGSRPDGTVRTTFWLEIYGRPIPAAAQSALLGLLIGLLLIPWGGWWPILLAAGGYGLSDATTRWVWPCSPSINRHRVPAQQLQPGMWVRLHGRRGPAGRIETIQPSPQWTRLRFTGGLYRDLPADRPCQIVELRG